MKLDNIKIDNTIILEEINNKFGKCLVLVTGSYIQGGFKNSSDIDLIIISPIVAISHNEKFFSQKLNRKLDCLVLPRNRVSEEVDKSYNSKLGALIRMISKGEILFDEDNTFLEIKKKCEFYFQKGKTFELNEHDIKNKCIKVSNAIEDLTDSNSIIENYFILNRIIDQLSSLYLIANNLWESEGKSQAKRLNEICPDFVIDIQKILESYFIDNLVSENTIKILTRHLNKFKPFTENYSTRKGILSDDTLFIELLDLTVSDYFIIIKNLSVHIKGKYKFYVDEIYFEYDEINQKAFIELSLVGKSSFSAVELYNNLCQDIFGGIKSYISKDMRFNSSFGGEEMFNLLKDFKNKVSISILDYLKSEKLVLDKSEIFNASFYLYLTLLKISELKHNAFSNYLYELWLPNAYDVKAILSYEQLSFEKEKVENHYHLRFIKDKSILKQYISFFNSNDDVEESGLVSSINEHFEKILKGVTVLNLEFFLNEINGVGANSKNPKLWLAYQKIIESIFNVLGIPMIDRSYIAYILKNIDNA